VFDGVGPRAGPRAAGIPVVDPAILPILSFGLDLADQPVVPGRQSVGGGLDSATDDHDHQGSCEQGTPNRHAFSSERRVPEGPRRRKSYTVVVRL
jgi:hypothetical protein